MGRKSYNPKMKTQTITLLSCALLLSPLSAEDEKEKGRPGGKGDGSFFKNMDTDGDGGISESEAGERWARLGKLDKDEDGKVTMAELRDGFAGARPGAGKPDGNRPVARKPDGDKPKGDRPDGDKPKGDRPDGDKPKGDRPDSDRREDGKGRPGGRPEGGEFFKNADKNNDGKLSEDEVPEQLWGRISQLDKNEDGSVSKEEMAAMRGPGGKGNPAEMLKRADKNGDGNIGKDEVPAEAWARMGRLDKNGDDMISREEFAAARDGMNGKGDRPGDGAQRGGPEAIFGKFDEDKDGKLSSTEVPAEMWAKVSKADTDADGLVSKDEMKEAYRKMGDSRGDRKAEGEKKPTDESA